MITLIIVAVVILLLLVALATVLVGVLPILTVVGDIALGALVVASPFLIIKFIKDKCKKKEE